MHFQWILAIFCLCLPFFTKMSIFACMCGITSPSVKLALVGAVLSFFGFVWWRKNGFPYVSFLTMLLCLLMAVLFTGNEHSCSKLILHDSEYSQPFQKK